MAGNSNKEVFDQQQLVQGMMDDEGLALEIARASLIDLRRQRAQLKRIFEEGSCEELLRCIHSLKGVSAHARCGLLNGEALALESLLDEGKEEEARSQREALDTLLSQAIRSLSVYAE